MAREMTVSIFAARSPAAGVADSGLAGVAGWTVVALVPVPSVVPAALSGVPVPVPEAPASSAPDSVSCVAPVAGEVVGVVVAGAVVADGAAGGVVGAVVDGRVVDGDVVGDSPGRMV